MSNELFDRRARLRECLLVELVQKDGLTEAHFEVQVRDTIMQWNIVPRDRFLANDEGRSLLIDQAVAAFEAAILQRFPGLAPSEISMSSEPERN